MVDELSKYPDYENKKICGCELKIDKMAILINQCNIHKWKITKK